MAENRWEGLSPHQLGCYGEYYAKMEFAAYGCDVYTSEVDDHGIDFVVKKDGCFYEIQVKSVRKRNPILIAEDKMPPEENGYICCLLFGEARAPEMYVIPAKVWKSNTVPFMHREHYTPPVYELSPAKKNMDMLEQYRAEEFFKNWKSKLLKES